MENPKYKIFEVYSKLFLNTSRTVINWEKEKRPIISLLEKYFTKEELEEFKGFQNGIT